MWCDSIFYVLLRGVLGNDRLTGVIPFYSENKEISMKHCITGNYALENEDLFDRLGNEVKDLIQGILQIDPFVRLDLEQIKRHSWMNLL